MGVTNATLATNVAGIIDDIGGESIYVFNQLAGILDCVKHVDTSGIPGITFDFPIWQSGAPVASTSVNAGTEGTDYTTYVQAAVADTAALLAEHQINAFVSDLSLLGASPRNLVVEGISKLFANAMLAKVENDIVTLFADFASGNDIGGVATTVTIQHFFDGIRLLKDANANISNLCAVLSPKQIWGSKGFATLTHNSALDTAGTSTTDTSTARPVGVLGSLGEEFLRMGKVGNAFGIDIRVSNEISEDVASGDDAAGVIMDKEAIGLHSKGFFNIAPQRDETARGFELVCVGRWKEVELHDTFGCYFLSDVA